MKFRLSEHPSIWLFLISLVVLGTTIVINVLYNWVIYALIAIFIAGAAVLVLGYSMIKDLANFSKERSRYYQTHKDDEPDRDQE